MIRVGQRLGKYRIIKRIADGGFSRVFRAFDTVSGVHVAIKVPDSIHLTKETLSDFRREVRISAKLDHPNILSIKDAGYIDDTFVVIYPLGEESLADRLTRRMSIETVVSITNQMLAAVAFAHRHRVMHCDIKPENFILFPKTLVRLADFGIAKVAAKTLAASGSGTVGYIAPEQAMGKPSFRSDVFSLGLIIYRMLSGVLPEWPYDWPPPGHERLKRAVHPDVIAFVQRAIHVDSRKRFADAVKMAAAFKRIQSKAIRSRTAARAGRRKAAETASADWRTMRRRQFQRRFRRLLETRSECMRCGGPIAETMHCCPWCGTGIRKWRDRTRFPRRCPRCKRGVKSDWRFCAWCFGRRISDSTGLRFDDARYTRRCSHDRCPGRWMMPFSRYCPWCNRKPRRPWRIEGADRKCPKCGWGVLPDYWDHCPWCAKHLRRT